MFEPVHHCINIATSSHFFSHSVQNKIIQIWVHIDLSSKDLLVGHTWLPTVKSTVMHSQLGKQSRRVFCSSSGNVERWECCLERHRDGGEQYHTTVKIKTVAECIKMFEKNCAVFHFSEKHGNHYSDYKYASAINSAVFASNRHPNL